MNFTVKYESRGRLRIHAAVPGNMTMHEADLLQYYLLDSPSVRDVKVNHRTGNAIIRYRGTRKEIIDLLLGFHFKDPDAEKLVPEYTGRELNVKYEEKFLKKLTGRLITRYILPAPLSTIYTGFQVLKYLKKGILSLRSGHLKVEALDATAVTVSFLRGNVNTAGSVMFLLGIGDLLEEWTHKKSVDDLARRMSLNVTRVWQRTPEGQDIEVPVTDIQAGDLVVVRTGGVIPFDGTASEGDAMVNQASITGESMPVKKSEGDTVFAGTVIEEGELVIRVTAAQGGSKYDKIVKMIEESEKLKSGLETKAGNLADHLVPYCFGGTILTYLLTRNAQRAVSVLMVDFSCALKLAMPLTVLTAMREAGTHKITVKGGKYLEAVSKADTIVFDKTGTLTKASPEVEDIVTFDGSDKTEMLRVAACLEEHFPHSVANAVVNKAKEMGLTHDEMHTDVHYIVAHGIASSINGHRAVIGSYHFVFEDEHAEIPRNEIRKFQELKEQYSHLYLAIGGVLKAVIYINDPIRPEAAAAIKRLKKAGFKKIVMMTGDSRRTAEAIAKLTGVDEFYAEVLPEDKADFVQKEKDKGRTVIMTGDGINDSPALSKADAGIAISAGAQIAREVADITISAEDLNEIVTLREISTAMMKRISADYRFIMTFNTSLIILGALGILAPQVSAMLHNISTIAAGLYSMTDLIEE